MRMKILSLCLLLLPAMSTFAQQQDSLPTTGNDHTITARKEGPKPRFSAGLEYLSDNVYAGRKDAARIPYLSATTFEPSPVVSGNPISASSAFFVADRKVRSSRISGCMR